MLIREQREGAAWRCGSLPLYISVTFARQPGGRAEKRVPKILMKRKEWHSEEI